MRTPVSFLADLRGGPLAVAKDARLGEGPLPDLAAEVDRPIPGCLDLREDEQAFAHARPLVVRSGPSRWLLRYFASDLIARRGEMWPTTYRWYPGGADPRGEG